MEDNYNIQQLIEVKRFNELSADEESAVLKEISQEEYENRRAMIENLEQYFSNEIQNVNVNDSVRKRARAVLMQDDSRKNGFIIYAFNKRIPNYISIAAMLLVFFGIYWFTRIENNATEKPLMVKKENNTSSPEKIYIRDTVTIEKPVEVLVKVPVIKYVKQEIIVKDDSYHELPNARNEMELQLANGGIVPTVNIAHEQLVSQLKKIGKSSNEQEQLNKFLVVAE